MKIIYLSSVCAQKTFDYFFIRKRITKMPQSQKYHHLLLEGLRKNSRDEITVISSFPIQRKEGESMRFKEGNEKENGILYIYPSFVYLPFLRQFMLWWNTIIILYKQINDTENIIVCDVLNRSICYAARFIRIFKKISIVGIVTDVPGYTSGARMKTYSRRKKVIIKVANLLSKRSVKQFDAYLLLTKEMNHVVNPKNRPFIVLEGHADSEMCNINNSLTKKNKRKTLLYAGGIHKEFGIKLLVEAFLSLNNTDWDFIIYGDGNYQKELELVSKDNQQIKYYGLRPNKEIVAAQIKADLLVNPRLTNAEYVKYSFPSKTLECMVSGTPLLTTCLPGMPSEYYSYVYLLKNETFEGFKSSLKEIFSLPREEMYDFGIKAKSFVLQEKTNIKQAEKFYLFLKGLK